jgi:ABC-type multidrug transport system fused ATPase/permease subunit
MGLSSTAYWTSVYVFQASLLYFVFAIFAGMGSALGVSTFTSASPSLYVALFLIWTHAQIGMSVLMSAVFSSPRVSAIVMTLGSLLCPFVVLILNAVYEDGYDIELFIFPPLAYGRAAAIILLTSPQSAPLVGTSAEKELAVALLMLFGMGSVCFLLGVYLHEVLPRKYGASAPLLFFLPLSVRRAMSTAFCTLVRCSRSYDETAETDYIDAASLPGDGTAEGGGAVRPPLVVDEEVVVGMMDEFEVDDDVAEEERRVGAMSVEATALGADESGVDRASVAVIVKNLRKKFGSHVAVKGLTFGVEDGECFGLLGPNGAGKTTTINMLTGAMHADSGQAWIGGNYLLLC